MNEIIYLSGGMSGLTMEEQNSWREKVESELKAYIKDTTDKSSIHIFNPVKYYNYFTDNHRSEKEVMEYDLNALKKSSLVLVNFNSPKSIGTAMEIAIARDRGLPIIGIIGNSLIHPWLIESCTRLCTSVDELIEYVKEFYILGGIV